MSIEVLKNQSTSRDRAMKKGCSELSKTDRRPLFVECLGEGFLMVEML